MILPPLLVNALVASLVLVTWSVTNITVVSPDKLLKNLDNASVSSS